MNYTVRIELHYADEDDYTNLHAAMEERGFVRWITDGEGTKHRLPTAEYNLPSSALERSEVLKRAKAAAASVKATRAPWVLVTESNGGVWSGLQPE